LASLREKDKILFETLKPKWTLGQTWVAALQVKALHYASEGTA